MKKIFFILPAISILYFSCTKNTPSIRTTTTDTLSTHDTLPPPPDTVPPPIDTLASGWEKIPLGYSTLVSDIFFIHNTGFAIGGSTIFKSSDGGNAWSQLTVPSGVNSLFNMGMGNEMNAIFVSSNPNLLVSTRDGGISFTMSTLPDNIGDVFFVDSTTAYAAGTNFWKTTDAGNNWVKLYSFTSGNSVSLYFLNAQIGWVFGTFGLYKTVNAGVDWQLIPTQTDNGYNQQVFFLNSDTGYISAGIWAGHFIERTMDGGASWATLLGVTAGGYLDIHFVSDNTGYANGNNHIYKTQDGGNTWTSEVTLVSNTLIELHFTDPNHGWACGDNGTILKYNQ